MSQTDTVSTTRDDDREECPHCKDGHETFQYMSKVYKFDVDVAREIVWDGREPIELEPEDVHHSVDICHIYPQHVQHVNPIYPGIIAHVWYPEPDGTVFHGHVLIDGHHRAARCLQDGIPYMVHILSESESRQVTVKGPNIPEIMENLKKRNSSAELDTTTACSEA